MDLNVLLVFCDPVLLLLMVAGVAMGIIFGAIPGLNTAMALALALPLTYDMDMIVAIAFLLAVYCGGLSGGSIAAILLNIPGTAASITTTFDGHPMSKRGESMRALSLAIISSFVGGIISAIILAFLTGSLATFALSFGPWEYFGAAVFSLALISTLIDGSIIKGFISTGIGLLLAMAGTDPIVSSESRLTFGFFELQAGINIVIVIIGLFALSGILYSASQKDIKKDYQDDFSTKEFLKAFKEVGSHKVNLILSSLIGTILGILPGLGGGTASLMAYSRAKSMSKNPEKFGTGCPEGIIAPEASNNAVSGGAMIPAIALGVPGSSPVALIMSAFVVHGVTIGPLVITERPDILQSIFIALIISNIFMLLLQGGLIKYFAKIVTVPKHILYPIIAVFCLMGAFVVNTTMFNVYLMLILAVAGMLLSKNGFPLAPVIMGFALGDTVETFYRKAMVTFEGSVVDAFLTPSFGTIFVVLAVVTPIYVITKKVLKSNKQKA